MKKRKITIAVICMSTLLLSFTLIIPLLAEISKSFPNATVTQVQLIYTIPSMISIPAMLLSGKLVSWFSKKSMVLLGMIMTVFSGLLPILFHSSLIFLYLVSALIGIGLGVIATLSSNIVSDYFEGLECARIMGYQSAAISLGGMVMSVLSGKIATIHWAYSYMMFLIFIPCIWIVFKFLPKEAPAKNSEKSQSKLSSDLLYFAFLSFLCGIFVTGYNTNIALFIQNKKLGGVEAAGLASSFCMLIGIPAGLMVGRLIKALKRNIFFVAVVFITGGFFITAFATNMLFVNIGAILIGFGFAVRNPAAITYAVDISSPDSTAIAISIVGAALSTGNFVSPLVVNSMAKVVGNGISGIFIGCGICSAVIAGLYLFTNPIKKNYETKKNRNYISTTLQRRVS